MQANTQSDKLRGRGPWEFDVPDGLGAGEQYSIKFRDLTYNKRKGFFKPFLPLDEVRLVNSSPDVTLRLRINGQRYQLTVPPNSVSSFSEAGITSVAVENVGNTALGAGSVVSVSKDPYDADDEARSNASRSWPAKAADEIIPGGVPW